jgi:fatty acid desaturase
MADGRPLPRLPQPEDREPPPTEEARNFATFLAVIALAGAAGGLLFLVAMVIPGALFALVAVAVIPLYFLFHYVVWGRLMRMTPDNDDSAADEAD